MLVKILISFCNVFPTGFAVGVLDFDSAYFQWLKLPETDHPVTGVTGLCRLENDYFSLLQHGNNLSSLATFDLSLGFRKIYPLNTVRDAHSMIPHQGRLYVTSTGTNAIVRISFTSEGVVESEYWRHNGDGFDTIHLNSLAVRDGKMYVTVFGPKSCDGWISSQEGKVLCVETGEIVCDGFFHPHTLQTQGDALIFAESRTGVVRSIGADNGCSVRYALPGYVRGLAMDNNNLYVGVSALRRWSRSTGMMNTLPTSDPELTESYLCRIDGPSGEVVRRRLTPYGAEVYDVLVLEREPSPSALMPGDAVTLRMRAYEDAYHDKIESSDLSAYEKVLTDLVNGGQYAVARFFLERLVRENPRHGQWQYLLGFCLHMLREDLGAALQHYDMALNQGFCEFWVRYNRGSLHLMVGNRAAAREDLERAAALDPDHAGVREVLKQLQHR